MTYLPARNPLADNPSMPSRSDTPAPMVAGRALGQCQINLPST